MKQLFKSKYFSAGLNLLLAAALVITLIAPTGEYVNAQPVNPVSEENILPIDSVDLGVVADGSLGQSIQSAGTGQQSGQSSSQSTNPGEEEQDPEQESQQEASPEKEETTEEHTRPTPEPKPTEPDQPHDNGQGETVDSQEGEEGGEKLEADLALVLTWYKYGTDPKTVVCAPNSGVGRTIQDTQLEADRLRYSLSFTGFDGEDAEITEVRFGMLDARGALVPEAGYVDLGIPEGQTECSYGFRVTALWKTRNTKGEPVEQELEFEIAIYYESGLDLEMELTWRDKKGGGSTVRCAPDKEAWETVKRNELHDDMLPYTLTLQGESAPDAELVSLSWFSEAGEGGELEASGSWALQPPDGGKSLEYTLTAEVRAGGKPVIFTYHITYENTLDLSLEFTWYEGGAVPHRLICEANESAPVSIKRNQLSGDQLQYALEFSGESAGDASILSAEITAAGSGSNLSTPSGSVFLSLPEGGGSMRHTIQVTARVGGSNAETVTFTIPINYTSDVTLQMTYTAMVEGVSQSFTVACENKKTKQAEVLYDNQLTENQLPYTLALVGGDAAEISITSVTCYQSGSGKTLTLSQPSGAVTMLLNGGKTGENTFAVTAEDTVGNTYQFKINIPYKHQGEQIVKIVTSLVGGETLPNESEITLTVEAWTEAPDGTVQEQILASGANTQLLVRLDGETYTYTGASGSKQQYTLMPKNPETGDTNEHQLYVYAQDSLGNWGETTVTFYGQRSMTGQIIGQAQIYVDMGIVGLGTYGPIEYDVLKDEPVSYVIAKALWGYEDATFGAARDSFSWPSGYGSYSGSLEEGFYLRSLGTGADLSRAAVVQGDNWNLLGASEEEILAAIDAQLGAGTAQAYLWRCIYRNGLNLGPQDSPYSIGEFDFSSGSGWMYSIGGADFYPGSSMTEYFLQDGDILTLRYTLAYGWDVGSGSPSYGQTVGYCVSYANGGFSVNHQMETVTVDGAEQHRCRCCGLVEGCLHANVAWQDKGDGTCGQFCSDCKSYTMATAPHAYETVWQEADTVNHQLVCKNCRAALDEPHSWMETANTGTCLESGEISWACKACGGTRTEAVDAAGHKPQEKFYYEDFTGYHYQICQICGVEVPDSRGRHQFLQESGDWKCGVCGVWHDWDCGNDQLIPDVSQSTCQKLVYQCAGCGLYLEEAGFFEAYHVFRDGVCAYCPTLDPNVPAVPDVPPVTPENPDVTPPEEEDPEDGETENPDQSGGDPPAEDLPAEDPPAEDPPAE